MVKQTAIAGVLNAEAISDRAVEPRSDFIRENALNVANLDV